MAWIHPHQLFKNFPTQKKKKKTFPTFIRVQLSIRDWFMLSCYSWINGYVCVSVCVCVCVCECVSVCVCMLNHVWLCDHVGCRPGFPVDSAVNNLPKMGRQQEMWVQSLCQEDPLEEDTATHSSILAWGIPWTEEPGGLQFMESQRAGRDLPGHRRLEPTRLLYPWKYPGKYNEESYHFLLQEIFPSQGSNTRLLCLLH